MVGKPQRLSKGQEEGVVRILRNKLLTWTLIFFAILAGLTGASLLGIMKRTEKKMEDLVAKQFEEPRIQEVVRQVAADQASALMIEQITPEVTNFKANLEKQKELTVLWSLGTSAYYAQNFEYAIKDFEKILTYEPENVNAAELYGHSLLNFASFESEEDDKKQALLKAEKIWGKLLVTDKEKYAFEMACVFAMLNKEQQCEELLRFAEQAGTLPSKDHLFLRHSYFGNVDTTNWFKELRWAETK